VLPMPLDRAFAPNVMTETSQSDSDSGQLDCAFARPAEPRARGTVVLPMPLDRAFAPNVMTETSQSDSDSGQFDCAFDCRESGG